MIVLFEVASRTPSRAMYVPGASRKYPLLTGNRNDMISLLSQWTAKFINLQLRFTYLPFKDRPSNTRDSSLQSQIYSEPKTSGF